MDTVHRREKLTTEENPDSRIDYVSTLEGALAWDAGNARIVIRYVPDRIILRPDGIGTYMEALTQIDWKNLEALATAILDDINNEVVARWVQVTVFEDAPDQDKVDAHSVMLEDRQPKWENDALLSRLRLL